MEDLEKLRDKIDKIDEKIIQLFEERMETVIKVAEYKKQNGIPILNEMREKEVIEKNILKLKNKHFEYSLQKLLIFMMNISKEEQDKAIYNNKGKED